MAKYVKGLNAGSSTLTATYSGKTASISITVNKAAGILGSAGTLSDQVYTTSTHAFTLTVTGASGNVTFNTSSSYLTVTKDGSSYSKSGWSVTSAGALTTASSIDAGTYTVTCYVSSAATTNYNATSGYLTWTFNITKATQPITVSPNSDQTIYNRSGYNSVTFTVSGNVGTVGCTIISGSSYITTSTSGNKVTVTYKATGNASITITAAATTNYNATGKNYSIYTRTATYTDSWNNPSISGYSYSSIGAGGGYSDPSVSASQSGTRTWTTGETETIYNSSFSYSYSMTTGNGFSINTSSGRISADSRGTTTGDARTSNTATVTVTGNSKSGTKTTTCTQSANSVTNGDYNGSNSSYWASVSIGSGMSAGGGSATVSASAGHTHTYYYYYSSGSTSGPYTSYPSDSVTWEITANGNSRFSKSGNTLSHSSMGTSVTTDTVTVTAYNAGDTSKTKTATVSITNALESISATVGTNPISYLGKTSITVTAKYTSNSTKDVSSSATYSDTGSLIEFNKTENI